MPLPSPRTSGRKRPLWLAAGLLALVAGLAACLPPPPPPPPPLAFQDCAQSPPTSAEQYQALFDLRSTVWAAGDTTAIVRRLDGSAAAWLFGDSFYGRVMPNGSLGDGYAFVNNSIMSEAANCLTPRFGGAFLNPNDLFADPAGGQWYWPAGAIAANDGSMQVMLIRVEPVDNGVPELNFRAAGMAVARVGADLSVHSITAINQSNLELAGEFPRLVPYGGSIVTDTTYAYLYGFVSESFFGSPQEQKQYVARVPKDDLANSAAWRFWGCPAGTPEDLCDVASTWTSDPVLSRPMVITPSSQFGVNDPANKSPIAAFHVVRDDDGTYIAVAKGSDVRTTEQALNQIYAWSSPSPEGPWVPFGPIANATVPDPAASMAWSYVAQLFRKPGGPWLLTWNANATAGAVVANVRTYGPRFAAPAALP